MNNNSNNNIRPGDRFQPNRRGSRYDDRDRDHDYDRDRDRDRSYNNNNNNGGGFRNSRRSSRSSKPNLHNLPLEQGRIHTLLDHFGFIYCAERTADLFFHYSEVSGMHSDDLKCGDEIQFHVGPRSSRGGRGGGGRSSHGGGEDGEEQLSAYSVSVLEPGTVQWETKVDDEGVKRLGKVERMIRYQSRDRDRNGQDGTIRLEVEDKSKEKDTDNVDGNDNTTDTATAAELIDEDTSTTKDDENEKATSTSNSIKSKKGGIVRFTPNDLPRSKSRNDSLQRKDLVQFTLVKDRRSGLLYARDISMVKSERVRLEEEREKDIMKYASLEQGVIMSLKNGFGFLRSNKRREEVYFHFNHVLAPGEQGEDGHLKLREGQDVEFYAVAESNGGDSRDRDRNGNGYRDRDRDRDRGGKKKLGARRVNFLPKGTVVFEQLLATGVTGVLSVSPRFFNHSNSGRGGRDRDRDSKNSGRDGLGKIQLCNAIQFRPPGASQDGDNCNEEGSNNVVEISSVSLDPKLCRGLLKDEPKPELWFKVGDTLLFNVVRDVVDGTCHATPAAVSPEERGNAARIRLLNPNLAGRAEGVVTSIRDNFGFVQLAHRNVEVYFRLSEVFPAFIQQDLLAPKNESKANEEKQPKTNVIVGSEVTFDLSLISPKNRPNNRNHGRGRRGGGEKEQLRAQRLAVLPTGSLALTKEVEATGFLTRVMKNSFTGQIRLDKKVKAMSQTEQYPLMTTLIRNFNANKSEEVLNFPEAQSEYENDVIVEIVGSFRGLEVKFIPVAEYDENYRGRISIRRVEPEDNRLDAAPVEEDSAPELATVEVMNNSYTSETNKELLDTTLDDDGAEDDVEAEALHSRGNGEPESSSDARTSPHRNAHRKRTKTIRSIMFDRKSLSTEFISDPPMNGDKVSMTITFSRSTEKFTASNMTLLERNEPIVKAIKYNMCEGFVLLEPVHTSFKEIKSKRRGFEGGGWGSDEKVDDSKLHEGDGIIMLTSDPAGLYNSVLDQSEPVKDGLVEDSEKDQADVPNDQLVENEVSEGVERINVSSEIKENKQFGRYVYYTISGNGNRNSVDIPKRGDLVTFVRGNKGKAKDVRLKTTSALERFEGKLTAMQTESESPGFQTIIGDKSYDINLSEVVSCEPKVLKDDDAIEAMIHDGKLVGICRKADLYLESSIGAKFKERSKARTRTQLNLTVKRDLGGKIIAQSCMAKGPDGSLGFSPGWTTRTSRFVPQDHIIVDDSLDNGDEFTTALNKDAEPFVL